MAKHTKYILDKQTTPSGRIKTYMQILSISLKACCDPGKYVNITFTCIQWDDHVTQSSLIMCWVRNGVNLFLR